MVAVNLQPVRSKERSGIISTKNINNTRSLLAVSYGTAVGAIVFNTQPALVGALAVSFEFSEAQLGNIMAITLLAVFCLVVSSFFWAHRTASRTTVSIGVIVASLGSVALGFADGFVGVSLGLVLIGTGAAAIYVACLACLSTAKDPARAFGIAITTQVIVAALTVYMIPSFALPLLGIQGVAGLLLLLIMLVFGVLPFLPPDQQPEAFRSDDAAQNRKNIVWVWVGLCAMTIYFAGLNGTWVFLERIGASMAMSGEVIGRALAASLLFGALGSFIASIAGRRISVRAALSVSAIAFLIFIYMISNASGALEFTIALTIFNAAWNFSLPYQMDLISRADSNARYIILVPAAQTIGGAIGPAIAGPILMTGGVGGVYAQLMIGIGVAFLLYGLMARRLDIA